MISIAVIMIRVEETFSSNVTHFVSAGKRTQVLIDVVIQMIINNRIA